jgi:hypothetical protein
MFWMALDDIEKNYGITVLDPKFGLVKQLMDHMPPDRMNDVIYLDGISPVALDLMRWETNLERSTLADDLMVLFLRFSDATAGDQWKSILQYAILTVLEARGSFLDIHYLLTREDKKQDILKRVKNEDLQHYWKYEYPALKGHSANSITTRMSKFLLDPSLKAMLWTAHRNCDRRKQNYSRKLKSNGGDGGKHRRHPHRLSNSTCYFQT